MLSGCNLFLLIHILNFRQEKSNVLLPLILNLYQDNEDARQNLYIYVQHYTVFGENRDNFLLASFRSYHLYKELLDG